MISDQITSVLKPRFRDMDDGDLSLARRFTIKFHSMRKIELKYQTFDDRLMCYRKPITLTYEFDEDLTRESEENLRKAQVAPLETEDYTEDYV